MRQDRSGDRRRYGSGPKLEGWQAPLDPLSSYLFLLPSRLGEVGHFPGRASGSLRTGCMHARTC